MLSSNFSEGIAIFDARGSFFLFEFEDQVPGDSSFANVLF
jgi:hypothetical protein